MNVTFILYSFLFLIVTDILPSNSSAPEFDVSEIETLFSAAAPIRGKDPTKGKKDNPPKPTKVQLVCCANPITCRHIHFGKSIADLYNLFKIS